MMKKFFFMLIVICGLLFNTSCGKKSDSNINDNSDKDKTTDTVVEKKEPTANTSSNVISGATIDGLTINNISLIVNDGKATFSADVLNTNNKAVYVNSFTIIFKDADGNSVTDALGYIDETIEPNNSITMTSDIQRDLSEIKSIEYVRND